MPAIAGMGTGLVALAVQISLGLSNVLFVLPLAQVIDEYTKTELRSLASVPLTLNRAEIEDVVEHAAEMHWSYDGNYYFISNNCAVETLKLLRSGSDNSQLKGLDSIMPNASACAMSGQGARAGSASAMLGCLQFRSLSAVIKHSLLEHGYQGAGTTTNCTLPPT